MGLLVIRILLLVLCLATVACSQSANAPAKLSHQLHESFICRANFSSPPACMTNFFELNAWRSALSQKKISLTGYVGQDEGRLVIYPSEQMYAYGDITSALVVRGNEKIQNQLLKTCGYQYCAVNGLYNELRRSGEARYLGEFWPETFLLINARQGKREELKLHADDFDGANRSN